MQIQIERKDRTAKYWFNSLAELARYLDETPRTWKGNSSRKERAEQYWDLGAGYDKAWTYAREGWIEGAQRAQDALKSLVPATPAPDKTTDFYGFMPHVPRYCAGAPDNMIRHATRDNTAKVISLIVPVNALGSVDAKYMANFGLGVAQYINQMETQGKRVEVIGAIVSSVNYWRVSHCWQIKLADQPLDLAVLAFAIGHPAMFRRLGFALREHCAAPEQAGYGSTVPATVGDCINAPTGAIVLNGMASADSCARTPEQALAYIERQIANALERQYDGA